MSNQGNQKQLIGLISLRQLKAVKEIIEKDKNLNLNEISKYGTFPTMLATLTCDFEMLKLLVENGAQRSLKFKDRKDRTVFDEAKKCKNETMIKFIQKELNKLDQN